MNLSRISNIVFWLRTGLLTIVVWLTFETNLFEHLTTYSSPYDLSGFNALTTAFLLAWIAPAALYGLVSQVWNKITPIKDKLTLIEGELVYVTSVLLSFPIFMIVFLNTTVGAISVLFCISLFAALPGSICSYIFQRMNKDIILNQPKETEPPTVSEEGFAASTLNITAYLTAAIIFAVALTFTVGLVILIRVGWQPSVLYPIILSIISISGSSVLLLTLFGHLILPFGIKIKSKLGLRTDDTRLGIASAWLLGVMTVLTTCLVLFGGIRPPSSINELIASWHLLLAYCLFGLSSFLGGLALRTFYKPKPISAIFT